MKPTKKSFLYFIFFCIFILKSPEAIAFQITDSLNYYQQLALHPKNINDFSSTLKYFNRLHETSIENNNFESAVRSLYYLSSVQCKIGSYDKAEVLAVKALDLIYKNKSIKNKAVLKTSFYTLLGVIYDEQRNKEKAIQLYEESLLSVSNPQDSIILLNNLAVVYKKNDEFYAAKSKLLEAFSILPRIKDTLTKAKVLDNLGDVYSELNDNEALSFLEQALVLRKQVKDTSTIYTSYVHLSKYYKKIHRRVEAKKFALKAYDLANFIGSPAYKRDALGLLAELSNDVYAREFKKINDSLYDFEKVSENKFALLKYDYSEFERKSLESELQKQKEKQKRILYQYITFLSILSGAFLFFFLKTKHKKENLQQVFNTESRISKKVHDVVANDLYHAMTNLQSNNKTKNDVLDDLEKIYNKTRDISNENSAIDVKENFGEVLIDLLLSYRNDNINVITQNINKMDWKKISDIKKATLFRVLQELMTNMRKHSKASNVAITFSKLKNRIHIDYRDDGIGCTLIKSNGLKNTENRIESIKGTITFESETNKGFKAKIII